MNPSSIVKATFLRARVGHCKVVKATFLRAQTKYCVKGTFLRA